MTILIVLDSHASDPLLLTSARSIGRRTIELEFNLPVRVRSTSIELIDPTDRYTPVDWIAEGGVAEDAANPASYAITRPSSGDKVLPGEAVELAVVKAEESEGYYYDAAGVRYSTRVLLTTDYQQTARADYDIAVENVESFVGVTIEPSDGLASIKGYAPSPIVRSTIDLYYDPTSKIHRSRDQDTGGGHLELFMRCVQEVFDRQLEDVDAFFLDLCDIDRMRAEFLDAALYDLGNPFESFVRTLSANKKRKLLAVLVAIYKQKGTCVGIQNVVRFFLGEDVIASCESGWDDHWILGVSQLGVDTTLGPGTLYEVLSFWLHTSRVLTAEEREQITKIAEYMKPAHTHFRGFVEPVTPPDPTPRWVLGVSQLGVDTTLTQTVIV